MGISIFSIAGLVLSVTCLMLVAIVLRYGKTKLHRTWILFNCAVAIWGIGAFFAGKTDSALEALYWWRIAHIGVILIPVFMYHVVNLLCGLSQRRLLKAVYIQGVIFLLLDPTRFFIPDVRFAFSSFYYAVLGPMYHVFFVLWLAIVGYCYYMLFITYHHAQGLRRNQISYFFLGAAIGFLGGVTNFFPGYHIDLYPYGNFTIPLYCIIVTYAILRYRLMDIDVIIKKTLVFAGLFASIFAILLLPTLLIQEFIASKMIFGGRMIGLSISTVLIVLMLRHLENILVSITDRYLFQKKYDYRELLRTFTNEVLTVLDLNRLTRLTVYKLSGIIKLVSCSLLLLDEEEDVYKMVASFGIKEKHFTLTREDTLTSFMERTQSYLTVQAQGKDAALPNRILSHMAKMKVELAIPLIVHNKMIGILTLGKKKSDQPYVQDDIDILLPLARTLSIAISNAELFDELSKTQAEAAQREKMAVIGTLSAGINHEICNPLGIIRGQSEAFVLNLKDGLYKNKTKDELLNKAIDIMNKTIKEVDRATAVTKRLSSFSKPIGELKVDKVRLKNEIDEVMALIGHDLQLDKIEFVKKIPNDLPEIVADHKQIQEIFFNLLRNAGQAIGERGRITVSAKNSGRGKVLIDIEDTGHGISEDKLDQIFNPFYTTKEPGKGTGLGLFIVRQIVEKNNGKISVRSKMGAGTTFTLEFNTAKKRR